MPQPLPIPPIPPIPSHRSLRNRKLLALTTLGLTGLLAGLLSGCSGANSNRVNAAVSTSTSAKSFSATAGNWKFTSDGSIRLASLAGTLTVSGTTISGTLHPLSATCASPSVSFPVVGSIDASDRISMTSSSFPGGVVTLTGTLAADQHSLVNPTFTVTGGPCASPASILNSFAARDTAASNAQQYQPITGTYSGTFTDRSGVRLPFSASLSQPSTPDANGVYHLTGYATFPGNPCLSTPVVTDSTVTGDTLQATYTDHDSGNTVVGMGTFSADAQTLTITNWLLSGCGNDSGTGLLTRQAN